MKTTAVVLEEPGKLALSQLELTEPGEDDLVVDIEWSGISTGTERLLWSGRMPHFPGMGYPLVPGYESVGRVTSASDKLSRRIGERVFVPGAHCFGETKGLFGGAAAQLVVPADRVEQIDENLGEQGILLALAATAYHALVGRGATPPDLIVGHGVFGRLLARIAIAKGWDAPVVWEQNRERSQGAVGYTVTHPDDDPRRDYQSIYDASGDPTILDSLISRLAPSGEIVLAGFYDKPLSFAFPPAFMREARIRVAAEWKKSDMQAVDALIGIEALALDGLISHRSAATSAASAYETAFSDPSCLKMILDWRTIQ